MSKTKHLAGGILPDKVTNQLAYESGFIQRSSKKFSASAFTLGLLKSVISGNSSFQSLVVSLSGMGLKSMSRQALSLRIKESTCSFLRQYVSVLLQQKTGLEFELSGILSKFKRVLVEDSTTIPMHKSNSDSFPNNGNQKTKTAGAKINFLFDYLTGEPIDLTLHSAKGADQGLAEDIFGALLPGDLVLRDRGYFSFKTLKKLSDMGAFWVSRLPANIKGLTEYGDDFDKVLASSKGDAVDFEIALGINGTGPKCRLIAFRLSDVEANKNRRHRKSRAKDEPRNSSKQGLMRDGWLIFITNIKKTELTAQEIATLYKIRWAIEIEFRALKQSCNFHRAFGKKSNKYHQESLLLAGVIICIMSMRFARKLNASGLAKAILSQEKVHDYIANTIMYAKALRELLAISIPDLRHVKMDSRNRASLYATIENALT